MTASNHTPFRQAHWIGTGLGHASWQTPARPAPYFRRTFHYRKPAQAATVRICGLGYYELYLNGQKVGDHVLDPVVSQYDKHVHFVSYDVTKLLKNGDNAFGVVLGTGWYDCHTSEVWHFDKASWRDNPKLIFELQLDGKTVLASDDSWRSLMTGGPIIFDGLRNGEFYDARLEIPGWSMPDFDDQSWKTAAVVPGPGGILIEQTMPSCRVMQTIAPVKIIPSNHQSIIYDLGQNITGWAKIRVRGEAGAVVKLVYSERLNADGDDLERTNISSFILSGETQTDRYTLAGKGEECWEPRFTYHGFQYIDVILEGKAQITEITGRFVHTSFAAVGKFESSSADLNQLWQCTRRSYLGNFTGIPTDCPHREKNGWTGDAQLAAETGLFHFDAASSYQSWLQTVADTQRPNGQLPGIVPSGGWGFNWGSGPAWDSAFILIPYYIYLYTGDLTAGRTHYRGMKQYLAYLATMAKDDILHFGLGDWCHLDRKRMVTPALTSTAYYYIDVKIVALFARLLGHSHDAQRLDRLADRIRQRFHQTFYCGGGIYANGEMTALACALYQGLCPDSEKSAVAAKLNELVVNNHYHVDFGILGAKYVPRALADHGYADTALRLLTQEEYPGWVHWLRRGATTLWEDWEGGNSLNHIMFGDVAAWMMQYLAGIVPDLDHPGFARVSIRPLAVTGLDFIRASYQTKHGLIQVDWRRTDNVFTIKVSLPVAGEVTLPDGSTHPVKAGTHTLQCNL